MRVEYELSGPVGDALRVCRAVVEDELQRGLELRLARACDVRGLPRDGKIWAERVYEETGETVGARLHDGCPIAFPTAVSLVTRKLTGPFANETECYRDDGVSWVRGEGRKLQAELEEAELALSEHQNRRDEDCDEPLHCDVFETELDRLTRKRDNLRALRRSTETHCVNN